MSEIKLKNIVLDYPVYGSAPRNFTKKLLSLASAGIINSNEKYDIIRGLDGVNLELKAGDRLGIIGGNGAGKTTLLKTMAGIYAPTQGSRHVKGRITSLISTGFGMDEEASGYQNIILGGIILGYSKEEMQSKFQDVEDFTELGNFLNMPIKTYSAGMKLRLAFAIATSIEPEILIIDEGIGAGDASFYDKAKLRVKNFLNKASILVLASHSDDLLNQFCNKAIYMSNGKIEYSGTVKEAKKVRDARLHISK
jgi:ABC-type polysaccharide/polyol phosphate transport system ATPase subunit